MTCNTIAEAGPAIGTGNVVATSNFSTCPSQAQPFLISRPTDVGSLDFGSANAAPAGLALARIQRGASKARTQRPGIA